MKATTNQTEAATVVGGKVEVHQSCDPAWPMWAVTPDRGQTRWFPTKEAAMAYAQSLGMPFRQPTLGGVK
jgi:hypothetical protein